ncbi:MerR family transcriptional regulator [Pseudogracilibacillus sp. ICA-222130]|uniref:MerR family transcriptional regulator n=1 Tax=Pseudogracilibacillus sp. ICA-222130 TaxID=3134655 RepID=UPI0030C52977
MEYKVQEVAKMAGVSVRTLHHYDAIGLLKPTSYSDAGYRLYTEDDITTLQQIIFFKALHFSLKEIKNIIYDPTFDKIEALQLQKKMLLEKSAHIKEMIHTIEQTILYEKGAIHMTNEQRFTGFAYNENKYEQEARERWGSDTVNRANETMRQYDPNVLNEKMNTIYKELAAVRHLSPQSDEAQLAIASWYNFLNKYTGHHYSLEAFQGLGQMYVTDERFTKNIDQFGEGLAQFMYEAMQIYARKQKRE